MLDVQIRKRLATGRKSGDSFSLDVSLSCATRRLVLFGHSGSGKTLTLQSLAVSVTLPMDKIRARI